MKEIIDHTKIKIPSNYVLIKPDDNLDKFHINGTESSLYVGLSSMKYSDPEDSLDFTNQETMDTQADHWAITGKVIGVPDKLNYFGEEINKLRLTPGLDELELKKMSNLNDYSLKYDVPMEVSVDDVVLFEAHVHIKVSESKSFINTDIGLLYLVRYDLLRGIVRDKTVYPLNGIVFFKWLQDGHIDYKSLKLEMPKMDIWDANFKATLIGEIVNIGATPKSELFGYQKIDHDSDEIKIGDRFIFKSISANNVENQGHFHLFGGEEILMIRRSEMLAIIE